ncbi:hypothetical protein [Streptomyces sp. NPDC056723]|uniref:hypothetical protein n=1 Tax=unclassified Streptomyces TaxID=2593676 RepID=UPI0036C38431
MTLYIAVALVLLALLYAGHDAVSVAIGRRALGRSVRRRTTPPRDDRSDRR